METEEKPRKKTHGASRCALVVEGSEQTWYLLLLISGSLRDSSTTPEPTNLVDLKLNFGPNKSLSYLDRMVLKKRQNYPDRFSQPHPPKEVKRKTIQVSPSNKDSYDSPRLYNELGFNYREIFQNLGASSAKTMPNGTSFSIHSKDAVVIEEVYENEQLSGEECNLCVVEEEDTLPHPQVRSMSQLGRVSIMCMTPTGNFEADSDALHLENVSSVSSTTNSPVSKSSSVARLDASASVLLLENSNINTIKAREQSKSCTGRVWSPKPCFVGLSEFFLAGVEKSQGRTAAVSPTPVHPETLSKTLLARNVWKPQESVCKGVNGEVAEGASDIRTGSPQPIIPLVHEPSGLPSFSAASPDSRSTAVVTNLDSDTHLDDQEQIHDFGIVDFLKAPPCLASGYRQEHRVSTISPLTLSPNPPNLHWSDDSDDDLLEQICSDTSQDEQRADQDADDRKTLNHLAWELASTTGRLTHCEIDDEEPEGKEDFDDDSIESNDRGSGLSSSEEDPSMDIYSANVNRESKNNGNTLAQEEVHALK